MAPRLNPARGMTLIELLMVIAIIAILATLLLPVVGKAKARGKRIACLSQLKQLGVAFHAFGHDHGGQFPMQVSTNVGGTFEFVQAARRLAGPTFFSFRHFQALSNELDVTKVLVCPTDTRMPATNFPEIKNENISYFIGLAAEMPKPDSILAGDRNFRLDAAGPSLPLEPGRVSWTAELHEFKGNVLFADGRAEGLNSAALSALFAAPGINASIFLPTPAPARAAIVGGAVPVPGSARPSNSQTGGLEQLERLFRDGPPSGASSRFRPRNATESAARLGSNSPASSQGSATVPVTNTGSSPVPLEPDHYLELIGQYVVRMGAWFTYILLAILLTVLVTLEILRRRCKRKSEEEQP